MNAWPFLYLDSAEPGGCMSLGDIPDQYVATLTVTDLPWSRRRFITEFGGTPDEARTRCEATAQAQGWTPPVPGSGGAERIPRPHTNRPACNIDANL